MGDIPTGQNYISGVNHRQNDETAGQIAWMTSIVTF